MAQAIELALLPYIQHFIERQKIVERALRELRPEFFLSFDDYFDWICQHPDSNPSRGLWGDAAEWRFSIHGHGCRLIHVETGEPLDWNVPDVQAFDAFFFSHWLDWVLSLEDTPPVLQAWFNQQDYLYLSEAVRHILESLVQKHILRFVPIPGHGTGYALMSTTLQG